PRPQGHRLQRRGESSRFDRAEVGPPRPDPAGRRGTRVVRGGRAVRGPSKLKGKGQRAKGKGSDRTRRSSDRASFAFALCPLHLYSTRSVLTLARSASEDHNLFPRWRFGLVSRPANVSVLAAWSILSFPEVGFLLPPAATE